MSPGHSSLLPAHSSSRDEAAPTASLAASRWRRLDPDCRLQLVARALRESDGIIDLYPLAL